MIWDFPYTDRTFTDQNQPMKPIQFNNKNAALFHETLKKKVKEHFAEKWISEKWNRRLYRKTIILFSVWIGCYVGIMLSNISMLLTISLYIIIGITGAFIGFNVMHDGGHGSYSHKKWLNTIMGYSMNLLGSDLFLRKIQHNVLHHTYTNIEWYDNDIDSRPVFRFHPWQERKRFHKYQHLYFLPLYGVSTFMLMFYSDFKRYFTRRIGVMNFRKMSLREHITFWSTKVFLIGFYYLIPALTIGRGAALIWLICMYFCMGVFLTIIFQLAHVVERTDMVEHDDHKVDEHRAIHEVETTANFSPKSKLRTRFLGGLNYQI